MSGSGGGFSGCVALHYRSVGRELKVFPSRGVLRDNLSTTSRTCVILCPQLLIQVIFFSQK